MSQHPTHDAATRDLLQLTLRLRPDLIITPRRSASGTWYQCELPATGRYFRLGHAEYTFMSLLDGQTRLAEAVSLCARALGPDALPEPQVKALVAWLFESQLAEAEGGEANAVAALTRKDETRRAAERLNPLFLKRPLGNPDRLIQTLLPAVGWLQSVPALAAWLLLWIVAAVLLWLEWPRFAESSRAILHQHNWLWLTGVWLVLKVVHELSHALVCRMYGGAVRETGIVVMWMAPIAYVDVTASQAFRSKWQRMHTAAAGMIAEITLAAVAVCVWSQTESPVLSHFLANVIWMAGLTTLLFNANPLMKFDGYYLLADACETPNLSSRGQAAVLSSLKRILLGRTSASVVETAGRSWLILLYGWAAMVWRGFVSLGLLLTASVLFQGAGVLLVVAAAAWWFGRTVCWKGLCALRELFRESPRAFWRAVGISSFSLATCAGILWLCPWPAPRSAPGYVEFGDLVNVRAKGPGFIRQIHVHDSQTVAAGDLLIELENEELDNEVADLELAIAQCQIRGQQHLQAGELAAAQVDAQEKAGLELRLAEKQLLADSLSIRAPIGGRVMARSLETRLGTYAKEGDELLALGHDELKEFRASLTQEDALALGRRASFPIRLPVHAPLTATVRRVEPRASREPPHLAITAAAGGPLAVEPAPPPEKFKFLEPRITVHFALETRPDETAAAAGTVGRVTLEAHEFASLAEGLWRHASRFVEARIKPPTERK